MGGAAGRQKIELFSKASLWFGDVLGVFGEVLRGQCKRKLSFENQYKIILKRYPFKVFEGPVKAL